MAADFLSKSRLFLLALAPSLAEAALVPYLDQWHETTSEWLVDHTIAVDQAFAQGKPRPTPPPEYRVAVWGNTKLRSGEPADFFPSTSLRVKVELPNISRRLRLILSTEDSKKGSVQFSMIFQKIRATRSPTFGAWRKPLSSSSYRKHHAAQTRIPLALRLPFATVSPLCCAIGFPLHDLVSGRVGGHLLP